MSDAAPFPPFRSVGIIGLGLIGGSLARDLAERDIKVLGYDRDEAVAKRAEDAGVLSERRDPADLGSADVVVLAVPIDEALALLPRLAPSLEGVQLFTDVCSTKTTICRGAEDLDVAAFVGSHPMAGDHRSGWNASRTGLFAGARAYVCPTRISSPGALVLAEQLWRFLGAAPERLTAEAHDREVAWTSHLPHVASAALAAALAGAAIGRERLGPGGRDATRLAASDPRLWTSIALDNATPLLPAIEELEAALRDMREAIRRGDRGALQRQFASAHAWSREGDGASDAGAGDAH